MKNKKVKILLLAAVLAVITIGIVMVILKGFNKSEIYQNISMLEIMKLYILPSIIVTVLSTIYYVIIYRKQGMIKIALTTICVIVASIAFIISVYAISRIQVNLFFMPALLLIFIADFIVLSEIYSKH